MKTQVEHFSNGNVKRIRIFNDEYKHHNEDGPAYHRFHENGQESRREYIINGRWHREDGPAVQEWDMQGLNYRHEYFLDGLKYVKKDWELKVNSVEVTANGKTARISKESAKNLGLI